ncbi:hypothetical protein K8R33_02615 [archaeon]|nr:hypothetical protein [archaeon]
MKKGVIFILLFLICVSFVDAVIIADHNAVIAFDNGDIPDYWIEQVKSQKIMIQMPGRSHAQQLVGDFDGSPVMSIGGLEMLEDLDSNYQVNIQCNPNSLPSDTALKVVKGQYLGSSWGGVDYECRNDDDDYWSMSTGRSYTEASADRVFTDLGVHFDGSIFGWSFHIIRSDSVHDEEGSMITFNNERRDEYFTALNQFRANDPQTEYIYATAPTDQDTGTYINECGVDGERVTSYNQQIRDEAIVNDGVLFDQADIEYHDANMQPPTTEHPCGSGSDIQIRHPDWGTTSDGCAHSNTALCVAKAKAFWWMAARMAGWDGTSSGTFCGDGTIQTPNDNGIDEVCDGTNFGGLTCADYSYDSGDLSCINDCQTIDTSGCYNSPDCTFTSASWSASEVEEGTQVSLTIDGSNCEGETISLELYEVDDWLIATNYNSVSETLFPTEATFSGDQINLDWITEWVEDTGGVDSDPEYIFRAIFGEDSIEPGDYLKVTLPSTGDCVNGEITSTCLCGGIEYASGYCCDSVWNPVGCGETWNLLYNKDFNDGQITDSIMTAFAGTPVDYSIDSGALKGNLRVPSATKNYHRLIIDLSDLGVDPQGEFYMKANVKIDSSNTWYQDGGGTDGAKMTYAFGLNGVAWVPETFGTNPIEFGSWHLFDNVHANWESSSFSAGNLFDDQWHEWIFYFKHNTGYNEDGIFEMYLDGNLITSINDVPYTQEGKDGSFNKIDKPVTFFGGGGRLANDWWYWVDDIQIYAPDGVVPECPDTICNGVETCNSCPSDCGVCPACEETITDWCDCGGDNYQTGYCCDSFWQIGECSVGCTEDSECDYLDDLPCIDGFCNVDTCEESYPEVSCDDSNPCTENDICSAGSCIPGTEITSCIDSDGCCPSGCTIDNDNDCTPITPDDAVLYLPLDSDYNDHSDNLLGVSCVSCPTQTLGQVDGAYSFDGVSDYLDFEDSLNDLTFPVTLAAWINLADLDSVHPIIRTDDSTNYAGYFMFITPVVDAGGKIYAGFGDNGGDTSTFRRIVKSDGGILNVGEWAHIAAVISGVDDIKLYLDGDLITTSYDGSAGSPVATSDHLVVGRRSISSGSNFAGSLDEVRIYDRALLESEIEEIMVGESSSTCTDGDSDGYDDCAVGTSGDDGNVIDCDDTNFAINPGADEVCNGVDDNCNYVVDEGGDSLCDDLFYCNGLETCNGLSGCTAGVSIDCSDYDLDSVGQCFYSPDNNPLTWDYFGGFTSECDEGNDECTSGVEDITSQCDISSCSAGCEFDTDCDPTSCEDGCVGNDYYDYDNVDNDCVDCSCEVNDCGSPTITYNSPLCVSCTLDSECDDLDDDYCFGTEIRHDEGRCVDFSCTTETTTVSDCSDLDEYVCLYDDVYLDVYTCSNVLCVISESVLDLDCDDFDETTFDYCENAACVNELIYASQTINLNVGWNVVSLDIDAVLSSSDLLSDFVLRYENGWETDCGGSFDLEPLRGYYVYSSVDKDISVEGVPLVDTTYDLVENTWNLYNLNESGISYGQEVYSVTSTGSGFDYSLISADTPLVPGHYWIAVGDTVLGPPFYVGSSSSGGFLGWIRWLFTPVLV